MAGNDFINHGLDKKPFAAIEVKDLETAKVLTQFQNPHALEFIARSIGYSAIKNEHWSSYFSSYGDEGIVLLKKVLASVNPKARFLAALIMVELQGMKGTETFEAIFKDLPLLGGHEMTELKRELAACIRRQKEKEVADRLKYLAAKWKQGA